MLVSIIESGCSKGCISKCTTQYKACKRTKRCDSPGEGRDPSFEGSHCGGEVMESGLNGPEAIPMVMKVRPSRLLQGSFALADDGIRDREAGMLTPLRSS
ncbi:hypothetical protein C2845_PM18G13120 [Panicum miliaceum]|uniref:Uncharacterized protein n=1 Tax=Panicum miliaceum TaxID=4540 RepID=A0A3L6PGG8_PANMI|nr:hypothetical protein C2845_PM18G13120 [Panicum miliaceum]